MNQSYLSAVKNGDIAINHHNFILGQLFVAANQLVNISNYTSQPNEVKLHTCNYDLITGDF